MTKSYKDFMFEQNSHTNPVIYCDLDGVLTDFMQGIRKAGVKTTDYKAIGEFLSDKGADWWSGLNALPDGNRLWKVIKPFKPHILSAIPNTSKDQAGVKAGKLKWVKEQKKLFAKEGEILIDDQARNIKEWESAGGTGILHVNSFATIKQLKALI